MKSTEEYQDIFIENVKWLRAKHSLSEKEISEELGIGIKTLRRIERGEFPERLSIRVVFRIEKHFGIEAKRNSRGKVRR